MLEYSDIGKKRAIAIVLTILSVLLIAVGLYVSQLSSANLAVVDSKASGFGDDIDKLLFPKLKSYVLEQGCDGFFKFGGGVYKIISSKLESSQKNREPDISQFKFEPVISCNYSLSTSRLEQKEFSLGVELFMDDTEFSQHIEMNIKNVKAENYKNFSGFGQDIFYGDNKFLRNFCDALLYHNWNLSGRIHLRWNAADCYDDFFVSMIKDIASSFDVSVNSTFLSLGYSTDVNSTIKLIPSELDNKTSIWNKKMRSRD